MADEEKQRLLNVVVAAEELQTPVKIAQVPTGTAVATASFEPEREWDGSLLACCGSCDRHGLAAFASTLLCMPCTMAHNVRATLPGSGVKKIFALFILAVTVHMGFNGQQALTFEICEPLAPPKPDHLPHPEQPKPAALQGDPEAKTFLAGATFNPAFLTPDDIAIEPQLPEQPIDSVQQPEPRTEEGFTVLVNGKPLDLNKYETTNAQIMLAKNEALEGMAQLSLAGRKMLHKHDDKDDEEWEHKKHDKKSKKHHDDDDEDEDDDDDDDDDDTWHAKTSVVKEVLNGKHGHHHDHHPMTAEEQEGKCRDARRQEVIWYWAKEFTQWTFVIMAFFMRSAIRRQLNIKGHAIKDYLSVWCCLPCAICQETRTITKNNVANGVWHSPTALMLPQQVPQPQSMASAEPAKAMPV